jgi:hypothetical protein
MWHTPLVLYNSTSIESSIMVFSVTYNCTSLNWEGEIFSRIGFPLSLLVTTRLVRVSDFCNTHWFWAFEKNSESKNHRTWVLCENFGNWRTVGFGYLKNSDSKNCWLWVFQKLQRTIRFTIKEPNGFRQTFDFFSPQKIIIENHGSI